MTFYPCLVDSLTIRRLHLHAGWTKLLKHIDEEGLTAAMIVHNKPFSGNLYVCDIRFLPKMSVLIDLDRGMVFGKYRT